MSASHLPYRPDIDGLRAIAVLAVVFCHARLSVTGGFIGVDVFFVISGFLISSLIFRDLQRGSFSLFQFWERRARRIVPALVAVTAATMLCGWFLVTPDSYKSMGKAVVGLALMLSNVQFWKETGYFAPTAAEKPLLHTWSLAVEEQFYLFVPLLLLALQKAGRMRRVFFVIATIAIVSFGWSVYQTERSASAAFYLLPARAWELLTGVLVALLRNVGGERSRARGLAAAIGLAMILIPCFLYEEQTRFPGVAAVPPVVGTALVIWSGIGCSELPLFSRLLTCTPMVAIGWMSYSVYLWHWPLFAFARYRDPEPLSTMDRIALVGLSISLGALSWRYVEVPFRERRLLPTRSGILTAAALASLCILSIGMVMYGTDGFRWRLSGRARLFADTGRMEKRWLNDLTAEDIPAKLVRLGEGAARPRLLVWGDSYAMAILPAIDAVCREASIGAVAATHSATAPALRFRNAGSSLRHEANAFNEAVMRYVDSEKIGAVLLVASWTTYLRDPTFAEAFLNTVDVLLSNAVNVYVMEEVPKFDYDVAAFVTRFSYRGLDLSRFVMPLDTYQQLRTPQEAFMSTLRDRGVRILDPVPVFLERTRSTEIVPFDSGGCFYRDIGHLSTYGALAMKPLFTSVVQADCR